MRSISASALSRMITLMHQGHGGGDAPPQGDGWFALVGAAPAEFLKLLVGEFDVALCSKVRRASAARSCSASVSFLTCCTASSSSLLTYSFWLPYTSLQKAIDRQQELSTSRQ
jgi:hypothetical protein